VSFESDGFVSDGRLVFEGNDNFHIEEVKVFTGDDQYTETDAYVLRNNKRRPEQLDVMNMIPRSDARTEFRLRHEPAVCLTLSVENDPDKKVYLTVAHHKGCVRLSLMGGTPWKG
jgi:hypothetical protein